MNDWHGCDLLWGEHRRMRATPPNIGKARIWIRIVRKQIDDVVAVRKNVVFPARYAGDGDMVAQGFDCFVVFWCWHKVWSVLQCPRG